LFYYKLGKGKSLFNNKIFEGELFEGIPNGKGKWFINNFNNNNFTWQGIFKEGNCWDGDGLYFWNRNHKNIEIPYQGFFFLSLFNLKKILLIFIQQEALYLENHMVIVLFFKK
jgi:hypothetical protein